MRQPDHFLGEPSHRPQHGRQTAAAVLRGLGIDKIPVQAQRTALEEGLRPELRRLARIVPRVRVLRIAAGEDFADLDRHATEQGRTQHQRDQVFRPSACRAALLAAPIHAARHMPLKHRQREGLEQPDAAPEFAAERAARLRALRDHLGSRAGGDDGHVDFFQHGAEQAGRGGAAGTLDSLSDLRINVARNPIHDKLPALLALV